MVATRAATPATMVTARAKRLPVPPVLPDMAKTGEDSVARILCSMFGDSIWSCRALLRAGGRDSQVGSCRRGICVPGHTDRHANVESWGSDARACQSPRADDCCHHDANGARWHQTGSGSGRVSCCQSKATIHCRSAMTPAAPLQVGRGLLPHYSFPS